MVEQSGTLQTSTTYHSVKSELEIKLANALAKIEALEVLPDTTGSSGVLTVANTITNPANIYFQKLDEAINKVSALEAINTNG